MCLDISYYFLNVHALGKREQACALQVQALKQKKIPSNLPVEILSSEIQRKRLVTFGESLGPSCHPQALQIARPHDRPVAPNENQWKSQCRLSWPLAAVSRCPALMLNHWWPNGWATVAPIASLQHRWDGAANGPSQACARIWESALGMAQVVSAQSPHTLMLQPLHTPMLRPLHTPMLQPLHTPMLQPLRREELQVNHPPDNEGVCVWLVRRLLLIITVTLTRNCLRVALWALVNLQWATSIF